MALAEFYRDTWAKHAGRLVTLDGMRCKLRVEQYHAVYPYPHDVIHVSAEPTKAAKRSDAYRDVRTDLGDDWSTDVLESDISVQADILAQLGE